MEVYAVVVHVRLVVVEVLMVLINVVLFYYLNTPYTQAEQQLFLVEQQLQQHMMTLGKRMVVKTQLLH